MNGYLYFKTLLGEKYLIKQDEYESEVSKYHSALKANDHDIIHELESGKTGWVHESRVGG